MTIINTNPSGGGGFGGEVGNIYKVSKDHELKNEYILEYQQEQNKDATECPKLAALTGFLGISGVQDVTYNSFSQGDATTNADGGYLIPYKENESFFLTMGTTGLGELHKVTDKGVNLLNIQTLSSAIFSGSFSYIEACIRLDKMFIIASNPSGNNIICVVYDILLNTFSTESLIKTTSNDHTIVAIHNNDNLARVVIGIQNAATNVSFYTTTDGINFNLENTVSHDLGGQYYANYQNYINYNKNGMMNYSGGKYWFKQRLNGNIYSVSELSFTDTLEHTVSPTLSSFSGFCQVQCTESGVFYFPISYNTSGNKEVETLYTNDEFTTTNIVVNTLPSLQNLSGLFIIDDKSACIKTNAGTSVSLMYTFNFTSYILKASITTGASKSSLILDGMDLLLGGTNGNTDDPVYVANFTATVDDAPVVLPPATETDKRYNTVIKYD